MIVSAGTGVGAHATDKRKHAPFMSTLLLPHNPQPMPFPMVSNGVAIVTQKLYVEITTDLNGDARFITQAFPRAMYISVNPTTAVQTVTASPNAATIDAEVSAGRVLHHSCKFTFYNNPDTAAGIVAVLSDSFDPNISTWNQDASALGQDPSAKTFSVADGFYAWSISHVGIFEEPSKTPFSSAVANGTWGHIKVAISGATVATNIGRVEVTTSLEFFGRNQLFPHIHYSRNVADFYETLDLLERLTIPRIFNGKTYEDEIEEILDTVDSLRKESLLHLLIASEVKTNPITNQLVDVLSRAL